MTDTPERDQQEPVESPDPGTAPLQVAVGSTTQRLQADYLGGRGERASTEARARLAELRRSAGFTPQQHPLTLQVVLDSLRPPLADADLGTGDAPSPTERAASDALTLFALHMQSAQRPAHLRGESFGRAMGRLYRASSSKSLKPRFDAMLAARDERSRMQHARSLITLLRGAGLGFDYGMFAQDLRTLSSRHRAGVLLRWGRDFARLPQPAAAKPDLS